MTVAIYKTHSNQIQISPVDLKYVQKVELCNTTYPLPHTMFEAIQYAHRLFFRDHLRKMFIQMNIILASKLVGCLCRLYNVVCNKFLQKGHE
jgi:hypothetical protein